MQSSRCPPKDGNRTSQVALMVCLALSASPGVAAASPESAEAAQAVGDAASGAGLTATPQRPSLSFNTATVPSRNLELEAGGLLVDGASAIPLFLKYGLTERTELELGIDAVRQVDATTKMTSSVGDLVLGVRSRVWEEERHALAVAGWLKAPTAIDGVGSGELDVGLIGVYSTTIAGLSFDGNLWFSSLGQEDGSNLGQLQTIATLGMPTSSCWSPFVELAWQTTAASGSGGFADAGVSCSTSRTSVFDIAAGAGWSDGYPDWSLAVGWTVVLGRPR